MFTYLKNDIESLTITFKNELPQDLYKIGNTYNDYVNGKWIKLNENQLKFLEDNPTASPKEIIEMSLTPVDINKLKAEKIEEIERYDISDNVNTFMLNGNKVWVDRETRVSLMSTTKIKQELGIENTTIWFGDLNVEIPCETVIQMLSTLEMYAYECFNKTAEHKSAINSMSSIDEIKEYDITMGYPEKLSFDL